ncbi:glycoside hydrolase family 3 C-terminal domain-containing protein [Lachnospiraceae bacterium OttesenSCG-928-D06]|nr:glycoside hydrolase family 3 C-terminal domain-containing protein [Lachnospiraceae bacterium OttesenSCG-928-D06]
MEKFYSTPLWDNKLSIEDRLDYLIKELTIEEKFACLGTGCPDIERLGIKASYMGGEAAHGIEARHDQAFNAGEPEFTTSLTQPIGMSSSFDRELMKECGRVVGEEARALFTRNGGGGLCRWAPTIDMERDPRWGRTEEGYGEDPYLAGEMSSAYIQGMKGNHDFYLQCGATLKHFYANNVENNRIRVSSSVDDRNKYEYYLEPFRKAIVEGGAEAVMTAYNEINGIPAIINTEVQTLLKDAWGLPGHVVCDGGDFQQTVKDHKYFETHAETIAAGLKAGIDCFTDDKNIVYASAKEALARGLITEEDINCSIRNSFRTRIRLGFFDASGDCPYNNMGEEYINSKSHQETAEKMAEASVVLLKNEENILPLKPKEVNSIAVVGSLADEWYKDWYSGIPPYEISVLSGIKKVYKNSQIYFHNGLSKIRLICNGKYVGLNKDSRLFLTDEQHGEIFTYTDWGFGSATLVTESTNKYVSLEENSYLIKGDKKEAFSWFIRESWNFKKVPGEDKSYHIDSWNGRNVVIDEDGYLAVLLTEEIRPGESEDKKLREESFAVFHGEAAVFSMEIVTEGIEKAVEAAKKAEKAIVVIGCNPVINSKEEIDRSTIMLPPAQQDLVDAVLKANKNTVVVLVSNYPYAIGKLQETVPGILWTASGSQELGNGIAAILSGKTSPAGRLSMTWYTSDEDLPNINDYDIIWGNRTYQYFGKEVLYPFGYGLSYAQFEYKDLEVEIHDKERGNENQSIYVSVKIRNKGAVVADEVVQLYVRKEESRVKQPNQKLVAFTRVKNMQPGETKEISFTVHRAALEYFDVISERMVFEGGKYTFLLGASSQDIRLQREIEIQGETLTKRNPYMHTKGKQYDKYKNCFIHTVREAIDETCLVPGIPGADTDRDAESMASWNPDIVAEAIYDDFFFEKAPKEMRLRLWALAEGSIEVQIATEAKQYSVTKEIGSTQGVKEVDILFPQEFVTLQGDANLSVKIKGKIKLCRFWFQ